jgi:glycyl-tRNA synthetase alpha chain
MTTLQEVVRSLTAFWEEKGCPLQPSYDLEVGAGGVHPEIFLRSLGPEPWRSAFVQPRRRPLDSRYSENPLRQAKRFEYEVVLKPAPASLLRLYLGSLEAVGFELSDHDVRTQELNWELSTLGSWGSGWLILVDGLELIRVTYLQSVGGVHLDPVSVVLTYELERVAMILEGASSVDQIGWAVSGGVDRQLRQRGQHEFARYYSQLAASSFLRQQFEAFEGEGRRCLEAGLILPAYECALRCSHLFHLLDARDDLLWRERGSRMTRVRNLAVGCARGYLASHGGEARGGSAGGVEDGGR